MSAPIDWQARALEERGPAEPTFEKNDAKREGVGIYVDLGGAETEIPRVEQLLDSAISADPATGEMIVTVPGRSGGPGYPTRGRTGLRLFAKQMVDGQRLAALGPDPVEEVIKRLVLRGEDPATARTAAAGLLWRERDGSVAYRPRTSVPVDPQFNASGGLTMRGGDELIALAASQLGAAMEADRQRRTLQKLGGEGLARLKAEEQAAAQQAAEAAARAHVSPYPRL